ncbi:hypothetical protein [Christensenella intestinihominis]|uniref:hypothetical protein n=1 Tax=Christensenella intestinihominis TaxID=1851429 RepID=UPI00082FACC6|nr:hypothetical protein [Christensenella intestinihominis]
MKNLELFDYIDEYIKYLDPNDNPLLLWKEDKLFEFFKGLYQRIKPESKENNQSSFFNFYVNSTFSGEPFPCSHYNCRMKNVDKLARFSSLYADKVLIKSPLDKYLEIEEMNPEELAKDLYVDILLLEKLRPLIIADIVGFSSEYICVCQDCLEKILDIEDNFRIKVESLQSDIRKDCLASITCSLCNDYGYPFLRIEGAEKYGFHETTDWLFKYYLPSPLKKYYRPSNKEPIVLPQKLIKKLGIVESLTNNSFRDLLEKNVSCVGRNYSYLTDRDFDIYMINHLHLPSDLENSQNLSQGLLHEVPFLNEVKIENIVKLRLDEGESFKVYRDSINKILQGQNRDKKEIKDIRRDIIMPEINKINLVLKNNKKALLGSVAFDLAFWGASISIGLFSGIMPPNAIGILGMVGGISTAKDIITKAKDSYSDKCIKNENFYFLWKLFKKTK